MKRILAAIGVTGLVLLGTTAPAAATDDEEKGDHKVTICHATGSDSNPYEQITVDWHALKAHSDHWGDIIPGGKKWDGRNWGDDEQAIYYNGCEPCPPEEEPEPEPEPPVVEEPKPPVVEEPEPPVVEEPEPPVVAPEEPTVVTPPAPIGAVQRPVVAAPVVVNKGFNVQTAVAPSDGGLAPWAAGLIVMVLAAGGVAARRLMPADGAVSREGND